MLSIFLIGIALSMDAFSISLSVGTNKLQKNRYMLIPLLVGIMHLIMPLIGYYLGYNILNFVNINPKIIMTIILLYLIITMIKEKKSKKEVKIGDVISIILLSISVSLDSFTVGIGTKALTSKILIPPIIYSMCAASFTYIGLLLGKYSQKIWKEKASDIGIILLILICIVNLCQIIF